MTDDLHEREKRLAEAGLGVRKGFRNVITAKAKKYLRKILGDDLTASLHAVRFAQLNRSGEYPKHDAGMGYIERFLEKGDVFIDVGANGADWAYSASNVVGPKGHVFSFEAHPYYARVTGKTIGYLGLKNVTFFPFGLSDRDEQSGVLETNEFGQQVAGTGFIVRGYAPQQQISQVELRKLDDLVKQYPRMADVKFVKLDVEGFELMVVRGAEALLTSARPVVIAEIGAAYLHGLGEHELFDFFLERDFLCFALGPQQILIPSKDHTGHPRPYHVDRIFIPKEKMARYQYMVRA